MKNLFLSFIGASVLLAGCSTSPSTPLLAFADSTTNTKDMEVSLTEMAMLDSFQTMGRIGQLPMGFGVGEGDEAFAEQVLLLQETFGMIQETMQHVQSLRFYLVLEGQVFKTLALSFEAQALQFTEEDASTFNVLVTNFLEAKEITTLIQSDAKSIRQQMGSILRLMNRPRTFDASQLESLQGFADSLIEVLRPLPEYVETMLGFVLSGQSLLEPYFEEGQFPLSLDTRDQIHRLLTLKESLDEKRDSLHDIRLQIREEINGIQQILHTLREQDIALNSQDQAKLTLLRMTIREHFEDRRDQQQAVREHFQGLARDFDFDQLDNIEETMTAIAVKVTNQLNQADEWLSTLQDLSDSFATYLA